MPTSPSAHRSASPLHPAHTDWIEWDQAWTRLARDITDTTDLTVVVAPGAGGGAPACHYPAHRRIEVDAVHLGDPTAANPHRASHKRQVPVGFGLLLHETAHAKHSRWSTPPGTPPILSEIADTLEEARAEGRHRARRPRDRQFLRATVTALVMADDAPVDDAWHAGRVAALLLARVDARILTAKDIRGVRAAVTSVLGRKRLTRLRDIWRQALQVADDDADTMIDLAREWCTVLGIDPDRQPDIPQADPGEFTGILAAAVAAWAAAATGLSLTDYLAATIDGDPGPLSTATRSGGHPLPRSWRRREPRPDERTAVRALSARLATARTTHPEPGRAATTLPPGRLRTRAAITAQAQIAAGQLPTAAPFQRRAPQPPDKPTLKIAILVDVSGSMHAYAAPMSSLAWILANAAAGNQAITTTIAFGDTTTVLTRPGQRPSHVREMTAHDSTEVFPAAISLTDRLLDLRRPGALRMVAVVSDGRFFGIEDDVQKLITTLHRSGVGILWLHPADLSCRTYSDTTTVTVDGPVDAITAIADAAVITLANA